MVFKRLFGLKQNQPIRCWTIPAGQRVYAIGDVHGRLDLLIQILEKIEADDRTRGPRDTKLIFLGDFAPTIPMSAALSAIMKSYCSLLTAGTDGRQDCSTASAGVRRC
jgi:serine/threonine protein phosphatase 1